MELTYNERIMMLLMLEVLEKVDPANFNYSDLRTALEDGYVAWYDSPFQHVSTQEFSVQQSREVGNILDMYTNLILSFNKLADKGTLTLENVKFPGFDGNNESVYMGYTSFLLDDLGRFEYVKANSLVNYNSHMQMLPKYRSMLNILVPIPILQRNSLSIEQIENILSAER